ncbi:hypothetical protein MKX03_014654 [Papaver bracteatum]|nr:hypothetical protein MKX03_014654 [Papaver bracteatum]
MSAPLKTITLNSSDGHIFVIDRAVALKSKKLESAIVGMENKKIAISFSTVITGDILSKVIEYLSKHAQTQTSEEDLKIWDEQFVIFFNNNPIVFAMIKAASYLKIQGLVDLLTQGVADCLKGKTPEALRGTFAICNQLDLPGEEEGDEERILQSSTEHLSPKKKKVKIEFGSSSEQLSPEKKKVKIEVSSSGSE